MGVTLQRGIAVVLAAGIVAPAAFGLCGVRVIPRDRRITAISTAADSDTFLFEGVEDAGLWVTVHRRSGDLDPTIEIQDANGTVQALGGKLSETDGQATVTGFRLPSSGSYGIVVGGDGATTGEYQIRIRASSIPGSISTVVVPAGTTADVPFQGIVGGAVNFTVERASGGYTRMPQVVMPGNAVQPNDNDAVRNNGRAWVARRLPLEGATGTYNLRIVGPQSGEPAVVRVSVRGLYSPGRATRVVLPTVEPVLTSLSPFTIKPGQAVTASGLNFSPQARVILSKALFGDVAATVTQVSSDGTSVLFQVPSGASGIYSVSICNPEGQAAVLGDSISVDSGVSGSAGVAPSTGPATGGTLVTVTGAGFQAGITATLVFGSTQTPMAVTLVSATELNFTTPAHPAGTVDIVLQNPGGSPAARSQAFTFTDVTTSRFFEDSTATAMPAQSQSGDAFAGSRGAVLDIDGDGDGDLLLQSNALLPAGASLRVLQQVETGVLLDATHGSIPDRYGGFDSAVDLGEGPAFAAGDLDGDLFPDLVLASRGYVPLGDNSGTNVGYKRAGSASSAGPFAMTKAAGKAGEFPLFWNDFYSATRILKNDGNGNFFSSPFGSTGARRMPLVGFYVPRDGVNVTGVDAADAEALSYAMTFQPQPDPSQTGYPGYFKKDPGFVDSGATGGERFEGDAVALADLDGDGSLDIVVSSDASVIENRAVKYDRGNGLAPFEQFESFARPSTRVLLNTLSNGASSGVFKESSFPLLDPSRFAFPDTGYDDRGQALDIAVGDIDGDDAPDIVLVSDRRFELTHSRPGGPVTEYRPGTRIFLNRGLGRFDDATRSNMPTVDVAPLAAPDFFAATRVALGDVDGDGAMDMILSSSTGVHIAGGRPYTRVLINRDGTGVFDDRTATKMPATAGGEVWQANGILLFDLDRDNDLDMLLTTTDPAVTGIKSGTRVLVNDGTGKFVENPPGIGSDTFIPPQGGGELWQGDLVLAGDLNDDGVADIVISEDNPGAVNATRVLFRK